MSNNGYSLAHTKWDCTYHIVFIPKYRKRVLYNQYREKIVKIIKELLKYRKIEIVEGAACVDHIHLSLRIPPKESVSEIMGYLKGKSAIKFFEENPNARRITGKDRTLWARGYYVSTVGIDEEKIKKYIKEQEESENFGNE